MATDKRGISALLLQRQMDIRYETAWLLLHKLRRAMVNAAPSLCTVRSKLMRRGWEVRSWDCAAVGN